MHIDNTFEELQYHVSEIDLIIKMFKVGRISETWAVKAPPPSVERVGAAAC